MERHLRAVPDASPAAEGGGATDRAGGGLERLARLLGELEELVSREHASAEALPSRLRQASAAEIFAILSHAPADLIASVLRIEPWPWEASFLACLDPTLRDRVAAAMGRDSRLSGKLARALRSGLEARLVALQAPRARSGRFRGLAAWMLDRVSRAREILSVFRARRSR
jgi:hypothetical protein